MDLPYALCDSIAKMIPQELNITIDKALEMNHELKTLYDTDEKIKELINMSKTSGGLAAPYVDACGGCRHQPEGSG